MCRWIMLLVLLAAVGGCDPTSGVIMSTSGPEVGSKAPDVEYVSVEGKPASFHQVRNSVALVTFVSLEGGDCCMLDPRVVTLADRVWDQPVTVAQFSLPKGKCSHGPLCMEACHLQGIRLMSLCDGQWLAWASYGRPAPGTTILIGPDNTIVMTAPAGDTKAVVERAVQLAQAEKKRRTDNIQDEYPGFP